MANTYTARIRAKLDSADLQDQIDAIARTAKEIKINLNVDGDVQKLFEQINSKMSSASKAATITPKVDTKQAENGIDVLQKKITRFAKDGTQSVENITKTVGTTFDKITSEVDGNVKTITQNYASAAKRIEAENKKIAELESQINAEISKTKSLLNDMNTESSMRYQLEQRLNSIQSEGTSKEKLEQAKALTAETKDWLAVSEKVLEAEQKITKEQREQEKKQSSAINKNQESEYKKTIDLESKINDEISKTKNLLNEMNSESSMRYQLEKRLSDLESQKTSQDKLDEAKALTAETKDWLTVSQRVLDTQQKITQEQRAQEQKQSAAMNKNQESLYRSISSELEKSSNYINKMVEDSSERLALEKQLNELSKAGVSEENLERAKKLTNEAKEKYQIEKNELATQQKINNEIKQIEARMDGVKMSSSQRLEIEKKIQDAMAMQNSQDKLNALKNVNTEIAAMGKNAMGLGAMLQTAYEKFANKIATLYRNVY